MGSLKSYSINCDCLQYPHAVDINVTLFLYYLVQFYDHHGTMLIHCRATCFLHRGQESLALSLQSHSLIPKVTAY